MPDRIEHADLFPRSALPSHVRRLVDAGEQIRSIGPGNDDRQYLHSLLCQIGMPRSRTESRVFERTSGTASVVLTAGRLWDGQQWKEMPLPYGTRPRLVLIHITSRAKRYKSPEIEIGDSIREFLINLELDTTGGIRGVYSMFKRQMLALAACHLSLGFIAAGQISNLNTQPISRFDAWLHPTGNQRTLWPGTLRLSQDFFESLSAHAVPLDNRALRALKHSALALDIYTWLAERMRRVPSNQPYKIAWRNLKEQFGHEYADPRNFKDTFTTTLRKVLTVYPEARIESVIGGLLLRASPPPIPVSQVTVLQPKPKGNGPKSARRSTAKLVSSVTRLST